eukprot:SAG11_NODE_3281_length_2553_cov_4.911573_3_plen_174_part_00
MCQQQVLFVCFEVRTLPRTSLYVLLRSNIGSRAVGELCSSKRRGTFDVIPTITVRNEIYCIANCIANAANVLDLRVLRVFARGTRTTCTSETSADDNPPVVNPRSTVGSIVGERSYKDSDNLELVQGGPNGPEMVFKASGGDTGNHASPQRALQDPSTSSSLFFAPPSASLTY